MKNSQQKEKWALSNNFKKGTYVPKHPEKYIHINNKMNESNAYPIYRSSWELKFFRYCDENPAIKYWTSEPIGIEYYNPIKQKICHYYPDFLINYNDKNVLIEIKPKSQTINPKSQHDKEQYEINKAKWEAALNFCKSRGLEFRILTEEELGIKDGGTYTPKTKRPNKKRKAAPRTEKMESFTPKKPLDIKNMSKRQILKMP